MLGVNYGPDDDPLEVLKDRSRASISVYARGDDYHDLIKGRLKMLAQWLIARAGGDAKVFVDTAAVMEKPLAEAAAMLADCPAVFAVGVNCTRIFKLMDVFLGLGHFKCLR